ncbi:hypothetical protein [Chitinophaga nivalis]|uniref:DUF4270 domain-containing protein n=1 Tax=Chitinophaga nivalis TaxID=2991709 RepID=A0ABT3IP53_9BACT|nr:hypothetical protein [Chitinophaga nivalis]MCW3464561.1 hypothetical protein [Chitinophaga nivalis]MCW3485748.1 hypothetical protein [Chitinophaga nivalis]
MAFQITYRRLATVNLLHSYYLDEESSIFYGLSPEDKTAKILQLLLDRQYPLMEEVTIEPLPATAAVLHGNKILYRQIATGLIIGIATTPGTGNTLRPEAPVSTTLRLQFTIRLKNAALVTRSNVRINPVLPANFYFTNDQLSAGKVYPSLAAATRDIIEGHTYEMGETALINGVLSQAITRTSTAATGWTTLPQDYHCISEYDRILLPLRFTYTFDKPGITLATFQLLQNGAVIKTIAAQEAAGLDQLQLDFSTGNNQVPVANGVYTLTVVGDNDYQRSYTVYLNPQLYQPNAWGVLDLVLYTADPAFRLMHADNTLPLPDPPVFDLRFLNRTTYWKYYLQKGEPPGTDATWDNIEPVPVGMKKVIISKQPYPLTQAFRNVSYATIALPNPDGETLSRDGNRICSEILLTKVKL